MVSLVGKMLGEKGWGIDAWPVVGMVDGGSPADECGLLSTLVFSLYFPHSFYPCISHTHRINTSSTPSCPLFPTITTFMHSRPDDESWVFYVVPSGWLLISPLVFLTCLLGYLRQATGLVRSMTYAAFPLCSQGH